MIHLNPRYRVVFDPRNVDFDDDIIAGNVVLAVAEVDV